MTEFKSFVGKQVRTPKGVLTFTTEQLETKDEVIADCLRKAKGVEEVKAPKPQPQPKAASKKSK